MGYRARSKFSAFPRPPDPPGQDAERLVQEAHRLIEEIMPSTHFITGSIRTEDIQKSYLSAGEMRKAMGLPDPYRMESAIPPTSPKEELNTELLYHPGTYMRDIITGTYDVPAPRPPPPPVMIESGLGMKPLRPIGETVSEREMERVKKAREKDFWVEWKILFGRIASWWQRDFKKSEPEPQPPADDTQLKLPF